MPKMLVRPTSKGQVTIPKSIRQKLNVNSNTFLKVSIKDRKIVMDPVTFLSSDGNIPVRVYTNEEIDEFLKLDKLSPEDEAFFSKLLGWK